MVYGPHLPSSTASAATATAASGSNFLDGAEITQYTTQDASLLPGLAYGGFCGETLVGLPPAFGEYPALASRGLDDENFGAVLGEGDDAGNKAFS
jgi:hypothetical protein